MEREMSPHAIYLEACRHIPGGVNSPVRSFRAVNGYPVPIERAAGCRLWDVEGRCYLDLVMGWGSMILGHAHPRVLDRLRSALSRGWNFGALTGEEVELARLLCGSVKNLEKVRLVNSGTEAVMSAVRLARAFTGRNMIVKFDGCYHGHSDGFLVGAGSGAGFLSVPCSKGVTENQVSETLLVPYNDVEGLEEVFRERGEEIAAIVVEPVAGNMGVVPPLEGFLSSARDLCDKYGSLLIFDEVITGFRFLFGSVQELFGVEADLVCLGKAMSGGLPLAAFGGRCEIMEGLSPLGDVYQAGTMAGNLLAVTAGIATLEELEEMNPYPQLENNGRILEKGISEAAEEAGLPVKVNRFGSMLSIFFTDKDVRDLEGAKGSNSGMYTTFFHEMLKRGVYLPPSPLESWFLSASHGQSEVEEV
ncbi:MAG: glutamate-1-semialdehyde 2,1-aminomutase, partial [Candidatus Geothermincolales bacterium]